ncbi:MAG: hypothetical protein H6714_04995 [Myxococcales bacterium]|nr:hypothetical protein [Myxococcales bacterium]
MSVSKPHLRPVPNAPPPSQDAVPTGTWSGARTTGEHSLADRERRTSAEGHNVAAAASAVPQRPSPLLASAVLWEDFAPEEPGKQWLRQAALAVGVLGVSAALVLSWQEPAALLLAVLFALIGVLGLIGLSYTWRASLMAPVALGALVLVSGPQSGPWLSIGIAVLSASLLFRAFYRSSKTARVLVGSSLLVCISWLAKTVKEGQFEVMDLQWQSWLGPIMWVALALLLLLSLLAFMEPRTTGGCKLWATALLVWYAMYLTAEWALRAWPAASGIGRSSPSVASPHGIIRSHLSAELLTLSSILLAVIAALSLWQLLSAVYTRAFRKRQTDISVKLLADKGLR